MFFLQLVQLATLHLPLHQMRSPDGNQDWQTFKMVSSALSFLLRFCPLSPMQEVRVDPVVLELGCRRSCKAERYFLSGSYQLQGVYERRPYFVRCGSALKKKTVRCMATPAFRCLCGMLCRNSPLVFFWIIFQLPSVLRVRYTAHQFCVFFNPLICSSPFLSVHFFWCFSLSSRPLIHNLLCADRHILVFSENLSSFKGLYEIFGMLLGEIVHDRAQLLGLQKEREYQQGCPSPHLILGGWECAAQGFSKNVACKITQITQSHP